MSDGFDRWLSGGPVPSGGGASVAFGRWLYGAPLVEIESAPSFFLGQGVLITAGPLWGRSDSVRLSMEVPTTRVRSLSGEEIRRPIGKTPRCTMRWRSVLTDLQMAGVRNFIKVSQDRMFVVPAWPFMKAGAEWSAAGTSLVTGGLLLAWSGGWEDFEAGATIEDPSAWDYTAPCLVGRISVSGEAYGPGVTLATFELVEDSEASLALSAGSGLTSGSNGPALADSTVPKVFPFAVNWSTRPRVGGAALDVERVEIGATRTRAAAYYDTPPEMPLAGSVILTDKLEVAQFFHWYVTHGGNATPHFITSPMNSGLALAGDAGSGNGFVDVIDASPLGAHRIIALENESMPRLVLRLTDVSSSGRLTLSATLPATYPGHSRVVLAMLARFSNPDVDIAFQTPEIARCSLTWKEVPVEVSPGEDEATGETIGRGAPEAWLYELSMDRAGAVTTYRFTSFESAITTDDDAVWTPFPIEHGEIRRTLKMDREDVSIRMRYASPADVLLLPGRLDGVVRLVVKRALLDAAWDVESVETIFSGEAVSAKASGPFVDLTFAGSSSLFDRPTVRRLMQRGCNHAVFDSGCGLDIEDWTFSATVVSASGGSVTVGEVDLTGGLPTGHGMVNYFALGFLVRGNGMRSLIVSSTSMDGFGQVTLSLLSPPPGSISAGEEVFLVPGCDGTKETCKAYHVTTNPRGKFNNFTNYGGFPDIPDKAPQFQPLKESASSGGKK